MPMVMFLRYSLKNADDLTLIKRFSKKRSPSVINQLYFRYGYLVYGLCVKYVHDFQTAMDITGIVFSDLTDAMYRQEVSNIRAWLTDNARKQCQERVRIKNGVRHYVITSSDVAERAYWKQMKNK